MEILKYSLRKKSLERMSFDKEFYKADALSLYFPAPANCMLQTELKNFGLLFIIQVK